MLMITSPWHCLHLSHESTHDRSAAQPSCQRMTALQAYHPYQRTTALLPYQRLNGRPLCCCCSICNRTYRDLQATFSAFTLSFLLAKAKQTNNPDVDAPHAAPTAYAETIPKVLRSLLAERSQYQHEASSLPSPNLDPDPTNRKLVCPWRTPNQLCLQYRHNATSIHPWRLQLLSGHEVSAEKRLLPEKALRSCVQGRQEGSETAGRVRGGAGCTVLRQH